MATSKVIEFKQYHNKYTRGVSYVGSDIADSYERTIQPHEYPLIYIGDIREFFGEAQLPPLMFLTSQGSYRRLPAHVKLFPLN